ncbi:hypothetical protein L7F22_021765 [Adiantum nelumboides]|nr:hypothetical protein [Adiantum nelumboides]
MELALNAEARDMKWMLKRKATSTNEGSSKKAKIEETQEKKPSTIIKIQAPNISLNKTKQFSKSFRRKKWRNKLGKGDVSNVYVRAGAAIVYNGSTAQTSGGRGGPLKLINGRGDWRGPSRNAFGVSQFSSWSTPSSYEFSLPPSMTVFEIDLDSFDEKPWRQSAVDISDFFNFGFDETTWKEYCKQLAQLRLESTMQSKIRVYESGRNEQDYDPDLPAELAAAAGLQEAGEKIQQRLMDTDSGITATGRRIYMPMPLGRPIEVEGGLGDRRPSADSRKQRIRDSDCILLIDAVEMQNLETERLHDENVEQMDGEVDKDDLDEEQQQDKGQEDEEEEQLVEEPKATLKIRPRATSKPPAEERRDLDLIRSQSASLHEDAEMKPESDIHEKDLGPLDKGDVESHKDAADEIHDEERLGDQSAGQKVDDSTIITSRERFSREVQAESSGCSSKRQRLVSPEGSHTASWDNGDGQKSARFAAYMKESRDSGESAMDVREDASRHRKKHRSYSEMSRGDQYRDYRQEPEPYHKKQLPSRHDLESDIHHADGLLEIRKRPKQGLPEKVTLKDLSRHSKERNDSRLKGREGESEKKGYLVREAVHHKEKAGSRSESKKRDDEDREIAHFRERAGSRPESRRKEEVERRDRHESRRRDAEDRRDRPEKDNQHRDTRDVQHRDRESEPSDWHSSDRRKKEDDYRRKDRPEDTGIKKDRERNMVERHDRDLDQHMRRKEEDLSKKERHEDRHKAKTRDLTLRESEDSRQRNADYEDSHGRAHKDDDERAPHTGRSSRWHEEYRAERAWRGRDDSRMSDSTRSVEARSHSKDRRKGPDDYGKEKNRLHEGRARSTTDHEALQVSERYDRDSAKHSKLSDDPRISGTWVHSDKHSSKRTKDFDKEASELATQSGDTTDTNKRKRSATGKNEQGNRKKLDDLMVAKTRDSQGFKAHPGEIKELNESKFTKPTAKVHRFDGGDRGSSGEDDQQRGRSKLERWMSHKDLEASKVSERLSSQTGVKRDDKLRPGSRDKQHRDSSGLRDDLEDGNRYHAADRKSGKHSSSTEQANGKASKIKEKGDNLALSKEVDINTDRKDFTDLPEHAQEDTALPHTNMAAKLEKRKERFKVSVEDKDSVCKLDQEEHQQMEKDDSRQERPPRKRRWASG